MEGTHSYVIIRRDSAEQIRRMAVWMAVILYDTGNTGYRKHAQSLFISAHELEKAIKMSERIEQSNAYTEKTA